MTDLTKRTARALAADLAAKKVSARELLDAHLARNNALHKTLNAVIATDIDRAMKDAGAIDEARARGETLGPLAGLPMTIKDGFDVENMPAASGAPMFADRAKNCADAELIARTREAGAVIWGKTNVPFMLGDFQSYNAIYGTTNNPYDTSRTPGGSSGGAAAALASGITPLEIGSDIGGSLRHPANFCGVCSLKPTWGVLPLRGHIPPPPGAYVETDLGVGGPMARNVDDLKLLWSVLRRTPQQKRRDVKGARIAVWDEEKGFPLSATVRDGVNRAADALAAQGADVEHARPNIDTDAMMRSYMQLLVAVMAGGFPDSLLTDMEKSHAADRAAYDGGASVYSQEAYRLFATARVADHARALVARQSQKDALSEFFKTYDAIVMPITPLPAFAHDQSEPPATRMVTIDNETWPYFSLLSWIAPATALHAPALAVQASQTPEGLPVGVQIVGPWNGEDRLFDYAASIEDGTGGFKAPPL